MNALDLGRQLGAGLLEKRCHAVLNRHAALAAVEQVELIAHLEHGILAFLGAGDLGSSAAEHDVFGVLELAAVPFLR